MQCLRILGKLASSSPADHGGPRFTSVAKVHRMVLAAVLGLLALFSIISIVMSAEEAPRARPTPWTIRPLGHPRPPLGARTAYPTDAPAPAGASRVPRQAAARPLQCTRPTTPTRARRCPTSSRPCGRSPRPARVPGRDARLAAHGDDVGELWLAGPAVDRAGGRRGTADARRAGRGGRRGAGRQRRAGAATAPASRCSPSSSTRPTGCRSRSTPTTRSRASSYGADGRRQGRGLGRRRRDARGAR